MGIFKNPFGGLFDLNKNGKTDIGEGYLAYKMFEECMQEKSNSSHFGGSSINRFDWENYWDCFQYGMNPDDYATEEEFNEAFEEAKFAWRETCEDGSEFNIDPDDYETEDEYNDALEKARYAWRDTCESGDEFAIYPDDYETEEEFNEALEEAKAQWRNDCDDGSEFGIFPEEFDSEDEYNDALESAKYGWRDLYVPDLELDIDPNNFETEEDYLNALDQANADLLCSAIDPPSLIDPSEIDASCFPNKRTYQAACYLHELKTGEAFLSSDDNEQDELKKCEFILHSDTIAGKYLTIYDGFLFCQAVKENFDLPVEVPDEDEEIETYFLDLFTEIAEEDVSLAVSIWVWCVKTFGPYKEYLDDGWVLFNGMMHSADNYPKEFLDLAVQTIDKDNAFCEALLKDCPEFPNCADIFIARALEMELTDTARKMFTFVMANPFGKSTDKEEFIDCLISNCCNYDELETMEAFKFYILPFIKEMEDKRIQRLLPNFVEQIEDYITHVEETEEKYQYSRRFAWRKTCVDGSEYGIDPLDYNTEQEYNDAIYEEKYGWRHDYIREANEFGLDLNAYEHEDDFTNALEILEEKREADLESERRARNTSHEPHLKQPVDKFAKLDTTVYTFCGVMFDGSSTIYHYRTDDKTLTIGDWVVVPVGNAGKEIIGEIVTVEKHRRLTAPYPVDKAKFIKARYINPNHPSEKIEETLDNLLESFETNQDNPKK